MNNRKSDKILWNAITYGTQTPTKEQIRKSKMEREDSLKEILQLDLSKGSLHDYDDGTMIFCN